MAKNTHARAFKYKILLLKFYFDKGFGITNYFKYIIAFMGLASKDLFLTIIVSILYAISCFIVGYYWTKHKMTEIEQDINNSFNPFVRRMLKVSSRA